MGNIINADILRQVRGPNIGQTFSNILTDVGRIDQIRQGREQSSRARAEQGLRSIAIFGAEVSPMLEGGDIEGAKATTRRRIAQLEQQGVPTDESRQFLDLLDTNPQLAKQRANQAAQLGQRLGIFRGQTGQTAGQRERAALLNDIKGAVDPATGQLIPVEQMTAVQKNAAIGLQLIAPVRTSAIERISTTPSLREDVIGFEGEKASVTEGAKQLKKLKFAPQIARDVAKAKQEVQQRGAVFTELNQAEAALPGLEDVVSKLKVLSGQATFTLAGRVFDTAAKELFGVATKGATARDKMISLVSNQVLPLLKPIFGSQFTEREGDRLIAAFADVNSTPESRRAQLDSFLDQMKRNIESKKGELQGIDADNTQQQTQQPVQQLNSSVLGKVVTEQDIQDTLNANPGMTREQLFQQLGIQ